MRGLGPAWAPMVCLLALVGVTVLLTLCIVPEAEQAKVLESLAAGATLAVLISRAAGR